MNKEERLKKSNWSVGTVSDFLNLSKEESDIIENYVDVANQTKISKSYKVELNPNNKQKSLLERTCGTVRFAYNWGLQQRIDYYETNKKSISFFDQNKLMNSLKKTEFSWMYEVSSNAPQIALYNLDKAFKKFFNGLKIGKKVGFPKFKSKHKDENSFTLKTYLKIDKDTLFVSKIGYIKLKEKNYVPLNSKIINIVISKKSGKWFASVCVEEEIKEPSKAESIIGIDLGIKSLATCSNGLVFENNKFLNKSKKKLALLYRKLAKKKVGSKNRNKCKVKLQKCYMKITNQRLDSIHKMTTKLVKTKPRYVVLEDLNIKDMMKNHQLAGFIGDAAFYEIKRQLTYKTSWYGGSVIEVPKFYPSSKTCSNCGHVKDELSLSDRIYECKECGLTLDRDFNASLNLEKFGESYIKENTVGLTEIKACRESVNLQDLNNQEVVSVKQELNIRFL